MWGLGLVQANKSFTQMDISIYMIKIWFPDKKDIFASLPMGSTEEKLLKTKIYKIFQILNGLYY